MAESKVVTIKNKTLICHHCENNTFHEVKVSLNKKWFSAFDLELFNTKGKAYICSNCGFKHEFYGE